MLISALKEMAIFSVANSEGIVLDFTQGDLGDKMVVFIHSMNVYCSSG